MSPSVQDPAYVPAIVLVHPDRERVRRTRSEYPEIAILAQVDHEAPVADVLAMLDAGADACVRDLGPKVLDDAPQSLTTVANRRPNAA